MNPARSLSLLAVFAVMLFVAACTVGNGDGAPAGANAGSIPVKPSRDPVPSQALLDRGSESVRGIAGFGRNAIPALYGEYALLSASGELQLVSVWYTRETLVLDAGWNSRSCPGLPTGFTLAQSGSEEDGLIVLVASAADYRMVIRFSQDFGNPCRFIAVLLERFMFFMRNATREEDLSFPAFLQL